MYEYVKKWDDFEIPIKAYKLYHNKQIKGHVIDGLNNNLEKLQ